MASEGEVAAARMPLPAVAGVEGRGAVEHRLFTRMLTVGIVGVLAMWAFEAHAGTLKPWNGRLLYPQLLLGLALGRWWIPRGGVWDLRGRVVALVSVHLQVMGSASAGLFLGENATDSLPIASDLFWLPMSYTVTFAALPSRLARTVVVTAMVAFTAPICAVLMVGAPARWPASTSTWMVNVVFAQVLYVPLLTGIARIRDGADRLQAHVGEMQTLVLRDEVTGLANRRAARQALAGVIDEAAAVRGDPSRACVVMMLDLDHFKRINDEHGHAAGDSALAAVAGAIVGALRASDLAARWGGEEFIVVARGLGAEAGQELAERMRRAVADIRGLPATPTVSIGVTACRPGDSLDALVARADLALYAAKSAGRDCVRVG